MLLIVSVVIFGKILSVVSCVLDDDGVGVFVEIYVVKILYLVELILK